MSLANGRVVGLAVAALMAAGAVTAGLLYASRDPQPVARATGALAGHPEGPAAWTRLARSHAQGGRFEDAARAYERAVALAPNDATLLADYADVLAMSQGRRFGGEPDRLITAALQVDPRHPKALALEGTSAYDRKAYAAAVQSWTRLLAQLPPGSEAAHSVEASIEEARSRAAGR